MTAAVHTLYSEATIPQHWFPVNATDYGVRDEPLTLEKGTRCIDLGDFWEVLGGPWDGIRFAASP